MSTQPRAIDRWLPVILWMGVIFAISSIPTLDSGFDSLTDTILRKLAHMTEYAILGIVIARAVQEKDVRGILIWTLGLGILFAISDEAHQALVVGRQGALADVAIDTLGLFIGLGIRDLVYPYRDVPGRTKKQRK